MKFAHTIQRQGKKTQRQCLMVWVAAGLIAACSPSNTASGPIEINQSTACALDGMLLAEYPGPKAQIQYEGEASPMFFCDLIEMFSIYLKPEQVRKAKALYVQDMGATDWENPQGAWIDATQAYYVVGSKKPGSMGPTFGSFAQEQQAQAFAKDFGGQVYRFEAITPDMASLDGGALHDHQM